MISRKAVIAVAVGLLLVLFAFGPAYASRGNWKAFEKGDREAVKKLLEDRGDFVKRLERSFKKAGNDTIIKLGTTYYEAHFKDKEVPKLKELSEQAYVLFIYALFEEGKNEPEPPGNRRWGRGSLVNEGRMVSAPDEPDTLKNLAAYYPRLGLGEKYIETFRNHKNKKIRFHVLNEICTHTRAKPPLDILLEALKKESYICIVDMLALTLAQNPEKKEKAFKIAMKRYEEGPCEAFLMAMVRLGGKRALYRVNTDKLAVSYHTYYTWEPPTIARFRQACDLALKKPETVLFLDNGARIAGEVLEKSEDSIKFLAYGQEEKTLNFSKGSFFRVSDNESSLLNPYNYYIDSLIKAAGSSGGGGDSDNPVLATLRWLHFHQKKPEGSWSTSSFTEDCRLEPKCAGESGKDFNIGASGLSILSFLGYGHTHRIGKFKKTVRRGLMGLMKFQRKEDGLFGDEEREFYPLEHYLAAMCMCEAYAVTRDNVLKSPAQKSIEMLFKLRNPDGGWPVKKGEASTVAGTAFAVLAAKAAKMGKLEIPEGLFKGASEWLDKATAADGSVSAMLPGEKGKATLLLSPHGRIGAAMLARIFCGSKRTKPELQAGKNKISAVPPHVWENSASYLPDMYFSTYALFQFGGEPWKKWLDNHVTRFAARQKYFGCEDGSFDASTGSGPFSDRASATALGSLTLEICFRYLRAGLATEKRKFSRVYPDPEEGIVVPGLPANMATMERLEKVYDSSEVWDARCRAIVFAAQKFGEEGAATGLLKKALSDKDPFVRANAVRELGRLGEKSARTEIEKLKEDKHPFVRQAVKDALKKM
ncbi:MAG: HEAT repeat domain-containing protein [Planctomycetota bacterium]|jgi:DNA-binding Xre family transcriptional regulator